MGRQILFVIILAVAKIAIGQNMVPNGDFESYNYRPHGYSDIGAVKNWFSPIIENFSSPDYFNVLGLTLDCKVPKNSSGYQHPKSGKAYGGIFLFIEQNDEYREYLEVKLSSPLNPGFCYEFEMYINVANRSGSTTDAIGVYFSDTLINYTKPVDSVNRSLLRFKPQIENKNGQIKDTLNWIKVSGTFYATSPINYLIIGNFKNDKNSNPVNWAIWPIVNLDWYHYVYIDDVSLIECKEQNPVVYPNPVVDRVIISAPKYYNTTISIFDALGKELIKTQFNYTTEIDLSAYAAGNYFYRIKGNNGRIESGRILKL